MAQFIKRDIVDLLLNNDNDIDFVIKTIILKQGFNVEDLENDQVHHIRMSISTVRTKYRQKFEHVGRKKDRFYKQFADWLNTEFKIPDFRIKEEGKSISSPLVGRPRIEFKDKSARSQRREVLEISTEHNHEALKLVTAGSYAAKRSGKKDLSAILKEILKSPTRPKKFRKILNRTETTVIKKKTPEEALSFLLDNSVSKKLYSEMRLTSKASGADIWPTYNMIREAKKKCRPSEEHILISDDKVEVSFQALLNHTADRIVELQSDIILHVMQITKCIEMEAELICSYGFDGSSGHSLYNQSFKNIENNTNIDDENLLSTTLIPLRLRLLNGNNEILWNNKMSQSPRFCRPKKLQYVHETKDVILTEKQTLENEISNLQTYEIALENGHIRIHFRLSMTLIDGKVLNIITATKSMQSCPICHATPKLFNYISNIKEGKFVPIKTSLQYGISPLHAWIRLLELCLHISYRLPIKKGQIRSPADKKVCAEQKAKIQATLWEKLNIKVDKPKSGGCGNSNNGNTARRAFKDPDLFAKYLDLNPQLLRNFKTILVALSCYFPINASHFREFCIETAELYIKCYPWYPMSVTLHKILVHGSEIVRHSVLPVGMLAEEASEARNKYYKNDRLQHSRKISRSATLADVFYRAMDSTDPLVSSINLESRLHNNKCLKLPSEVIHLLEISEPSQLVSEVGQDVSDPETSRNSDFNEHDSETEDESENDPDDLELTDDEEKV